MIRVATFVVLLAVLVASAWWFRLRVDPHDDPSLTLPPPLVAAQEIRGSIALFEGSDLLDWKTEGLHEGNDGTLVLGGHVASTASPPRMLQEGESLEFDFFQEGQGGATLRLAPLLLAPQPPDPEFLRDVRYDLSLSGFVYKRWHHVTVRASHDGTNTRVEITIKPHHDGPGRGGGSTHSLPARGGCSYRIAFETAKDSTLHLRNMFVRPNEPAP
jgi:hypothetical protein